MPFRSVRDYQAKTLHREDSQIQGPTLETLLKKAKKKLEFDMIIMGSHGRNAITELFMGSFSKGIVSQFSYPIIIFPTHQ